MVKHGAAEAVAVVGTGTMGRGIALLATRAGFAVRLADSQKKQVEAAGIWVADACTETTPNTPLNSKATLR